MKNIPQPASQSQFRVQVGHLTAMVAGGDRAEAITAARFRFCEDMPRLWDRIQSLQDGEFHVERIVTT